MVTLGPIATVSPPCLQYAHPATGPPHRCYKIGAHLFIITIKSFLIRPVLDLTGVLSKPLLTHPNLYEFDQVSLALLVAVRLHPSLALVVHVQFLVRRQLTIRNC